MFIFSPGNTSGFNELARSFRLSTRTRCSWATLLRLKSLVRMGALIFLASSISFRSTSRSWGKSSSTICTPSKGWDCIFCRTSSPRRPRCRREPSEESPTICNSRSTNSGTTSVPSRKPVSTTSAMRPSIMALVSTILRLRLPPARSPAKSSARPPVKFSRSPLLAPTISPMYDISMSTKSCSKARVPPGGRLPLSTMPNRAAPAMPSTLPKTAPRRRFMLNARTRSSKTITAEAATAPRTAAAQGCKSKGRRKKQVAVRTTMSSTRMITRSIRAPCRCQAVTQHDRKKCKLQTPGVYRPHWYSGKKKSRSRVSCGFGMFSWSPLVLGYLGVNLLAPGLNSTGKVLHLEAGLLQELRGFLAAATHLAVGHDLPALIQLTHAILQVAQWNEIPADFRDLVFMRFAHIEEEVVLAGVALLLERSHRNLLDTVNQWR